MGRVAGGPQAVENRLWRPRLRRTLEGMEVTFVKRRNGYDVRIRRERGPELTPRGGPGGRPPVPHDAAHLIVEQEARLRGGVFGRLADANGLDGLFWPADPAERRKASRRNRKPTAAQAADMARSEYLASLTAALWEVERGHRQATGRPLARGPGQRPRSTSNPLSWTGSSPATTTSHRAGRNSPTAESSRCSGAEPWPYGAHAHAHATNGGTLPSSFASVSGNTAMIRSRYSTHYYLAFHEIDSPSEDEKFYQAAERLLLRINGLGRVENQNFRPVALSDEYTTSDGRRHTVLRPAPAQIRVNVGRVNVGRPTVTVARPDGTVVPDPPSPWPDRFAAAASNPDLAEALEVLGKPENVWWSDLYWVFEIITDVIGGRSKIYDELDACQVDSGTPSRASYRGA